MTLKARFSLIAIGIAVFVVATPLLVLYARGFKYDFTTHKIVKTGTLVVTTEPDNADIYLDNKKQAGKTPASIRFLPPKDYDVRIEKSGYQSWTKRLTVSSQLVTWANKARDFITLFLSVPKIESASNANNPLVSKDGNEIVFLQDGQYKYLNVAKGAVTTLGAVSDVKPPNNIFPAPFQWQNASKIFEILLSKNTIPVPEKQLSETKYSESDGTRIIFLFNADLYSYDLIQAKLVDKNVTGATLSDDGIWYVQESELKHLNFNTGLTEVAADNLPIASAVKILRVENKVFLTLDNTLYVVNDKLEKIFSPVTFTNWDSVSSQLLFGNANEIQIYNPTTKQTDLILRSRTEITGALLNFKTGYIFYGNENQIKAVELDDQDHRNIYTIIAGAGTKPIFELSPDGDKLYLFNSGEFKTFAIR